MQSHGLVVQPDFGHKVHGIEVQPNCLALPKLGHGETSTVKGDAFIVLFDLLPAARHANRASVNTRREDPLLMPIGLSAGIVRIKDNLPGAVER